MDLTANPLKQNLQEGGAQVIAVEVLILSLDYT